MSSRQTPRTSSATMKHRPPSPTPSANGAAPPLVDGPRDATLAVTADDVAHHRRRAASAPRRRTLRNERRLHMPFAGIVAGRIALPAPAFFEPSPLTRSQAASVLGR